MFIADIGINHNGDINIAKELIKQAKICGVDVVKFQKRNPDICVPEDQKNIVKNTIFGTMKYIDYKKKIEFGKEEYDEIDRYCKEIGIRWTASVWDIDSLNFLMNYDVPFIKIPSACITDFELLKAINKTGKYVIISTGMSTMQEIQNAVKIFNNASDISILQCNSSYPSSEYELDVAFIPKLKEIFGCSVGYSGHEIGYLPTLIARAAGASIIERHITLDKTMKGTDHLASLDIYDLKECIQKLRYVDRILGFPYKIVYDSEIPVKNKLRRF